MSLDLGKLEKVKPSADGGATARCPVCSQDGGDKAGVHLRIWSDGAFACVRFPGEKEHRRQIYAVAGDRSAGARGDSPVPARVVFRRRLMAQRFEEMAPSQFGSIKRRRWAPDDIRAASPGSIPDDPMAQALCLVRLFRPFDVVWTGGHYDSGKPYHATHFRTARAWLKGGLISGPRICPSAFVPGTVERSKRTVKAWRFLVVESDELTKPEQGGVFRWLMQSGAALRAVVDTAGRSLHGWFDLPPKRELEKLPAFLRVFKADLAVVQPAQPCRLPGWPRDDTGKLPTLIYYAP